MKNWRKRVVSWQCGGTLYLSIPFTWLLAEAEQLASAHRGRVVAGGPAVALCGAPWADETPETCPFDVLAMHNPCATFTSRGCPNECAYCAVPKIEGDFRELPTWKAAPIVCDNNLLAASHAHFERVIDSLMPFPACDFNQGLDASRFTGWHAGQIARLKQPMLRFALDHMTQTGAVQDALITARAAGLRHFGIYVLIGFEDTPVDALTRLEIVRAWGIRPNPMRYQPLDAVERNAYLCPNWPQDGEAMLRMISYYSRLRWLEHIPYADYERTVHEHLGDPALPLFAGTRL